MSKTKKTKRGVRRVRRVRVSAAVRLRRQTVAYLRACGWQVRRWGGQLLAHQPGKRGIAVYSCRHADLADQEAMSERSPHIFPLLERGVRFVLIGWPGPLPVEAHLTAQGGVAWCRAELAGMLI